MSKKHSRNNPPRDKKKPDSVFKEAWDNMNDDMARVMPGFLAKRLQNRKGKAWAMLIMAFVELVVLGVIGKILYDWLSK